MPSPPQGTFEYTGFPPGTPILGGWSVTQAHGLTPTIFSVRVPMIVGGSQPSKNGDVILRYDQTVITLPNCTIDKIEQDIGGALIWDVTILDRRWRWRDAQISGIYNARWKNGTDVREETKETPAILAELCVLALGEEDYDVSILRQFSELDWPEINWNVASPTEALQALCERYEMRAIYNWQTDRIEVVRPGHGRLLDLSLPYVQYSGAGDPPEKPGKLAIKCGFSSVQFDFPLEAVARDADGKVKLPDQVSYAPKPPQFPEGGTPPDFTSGTFCDEKWRPWAGMDNGFYNISVPYLRNLALEDMLKLYRIVPPATLEGLELIAGDADAEDIEGIADFGSISEDDTRSWLWQIVLQSDQNDRLSILADPLNTQFDEYNQEVSQSQLPAWVYGNWHYEYGSGGGGANVLGTNGIDDLDKLNPDVVFSPPQQGASTLPNVDVPAELQEKVRDTGFYTGSFSIDPDRGLVRFSEPVFQMLEPKDSQITYKNANGSDFAPEGLAACRFPATLWLRVRFFVRHPKTREIIRYQKTRVLDENSNTTRVVVRDDLVLKLTYRPRAPVQRTSYPATFPIGLTPNNQDEIDRACNAYLDQLVDEYETKRPETIVYPGFSDWTLDGAIRQVTWEVNDKGEAYTRVSRDTEELHIVRDYASVRLADRLRTMANQANQQPQPIAGQNLPFLIAGLGGSL